jgi:hypothetical protein
MNAKERLREEIAGHVKQYLDAGGTIESVPSRRYVPACYKWMLDFGWDHEPWNHIGGMYSGERVYEVQQLEEGCSISKCLPFEGMSDE